MFGKRGLIYEGQSQKEVLLFFYVEEWEIKRKSRRKDLELRN